MVEISKNKHLIVLVIDTDKTPSWKTKTKNWLDGKSQRTVTGMKYL